MFRTHDSIVTAQFWYVSIKFWGKIEKDKNTFHFSILLHYVYLSMSERSAEMETNMRRFERFGTICSI